MNSKTLNNITLLIYILTITVLLLISFVIIQTPLSYILYTVIILKIFKLIKDREKKLC